MWFLPTSPFETRAHLRKQKILICAINKNYLHNTNAINKAYLHNTKGFIHGLID